MANLVFRTTTAGRAALVNAANTGTLPVVVTQIGVTSTAFTAAADGGDTVLPGELKRLATFGGAAVADDIIHVTIQDDSTDVYSLRGFALYLADGTLFGLYGQADVILEKSAQASSLLSVDVKFADIDAGAITFGPMGFTNPPATTEVPGVVEMATNAETNAGDDNARAVHPAGLKYTLDQRFGAGAPSTFLKGLLSLTTAALLRTAIEIKSAALKNEGAGNGLDADLLDGQHGTYYRAWANLTGVPATFTPSAHQHSAADITSGMLPVARGGTGAGSFTAGSYLIGNGTGAFGSKTPAQVLGDIGAAPVLHSHEISAVLGLQAALDQVATTAIAGKVELADATEAQGLIDATRALTPATLAAALKGANQSLANSGYQALPGGLIIQWCTTGASSNGTATCTFPIAFPHAVFRVYAVEANGSGWLIDAGKDLFSVWAENTSQRTLAGASFEVRTSNGGSTSPVSGAGAQIFAIGY